jgi:hypothetical protein
LKILINNILITELDEELGEKQVSISVTTMFPRKSGPLLETDTTSRDIYIKFIQENEEIINMNQEEETIKSMESTIAKGPRRNKIFS